jgi:hypothetical protein
MRLTVLVPSREYEASAGARIRYGRIAPDLRRESVELRLLDIAQFDPLREDYDAVLISKCHDVRSIIIAAIASGQGKLVGLDLFDDYFSQSSDSRLTRYRNWLSQLIGSCDFALCSTAAMAEVVARYRPDIPVHTMNDPAAKQEFDRLPETIRQKTEAARSARLVRAAWFGVGDNPYFPVGLADLAAHRDHLAELGAEDFHVELTVLTNRRALSAEGLSLIGQLPVSTRVAEWTQAAEAQLLRDAMVAFLPVSAGSFSIAKSLNRAITALSSGTQILSVGYPLYAALEPLVYRDARELARDIASGMMRFSDQSMGTYGRLVECLASSETEAARLAVFLNHLSPRSARQERPLSLVHGQSTRIEAHRLIREVKGLSVASPYCSAALDFDVIFRGAGAALKMVVSKAAAERLLPGARQRSRRSGEFVSLVDESGAFEMQGKAYDWRIAPVPFQLASYASTMKCIEQRLTQSFGPLRTIFSEVSPLPFGASTAADQ